MKCSLFVRMIMAPPRLKVIRRFIDQPALKLLDIGCGNQSCERTKKVLPVDLYHGVDKDYYQGAQDDYEKMDRVFFLDLEKDSLEDIPERFYDLIIFSHVIEHLDNGLEILGKLINMLAPAGLIYIETPSERTLSYPSGIGFLNFHDDATHKRLYRIEEIRKTLEQRGVRVLCSGYRRDWIRILCLSPIAMLVNLFYYLPVKRKLSAFGLWDLLGVARFAIGRNQTSPEIHREARQDRSAATPQR